MTVKECYSLFQGDYNEVYDRFKTDDRIKKFLFMFLKDENYNGLCKAMDEGDYEKAFLHVHTLKGMCANLSITVLQREASELTEYLRGGSCSDEAIKCYGDIKRDYTITREAIEQLKE